MKSRTNPIVYWGGRVALVGGFALGVTVLLLWLAGKFSPKIPLPPEVTFPATQTMPAEGTAVAARYIVVPLVESAVGTIRAVHETSIGSKILARVMEVNLKAGQGVQAGEVLVRLNDTDLRARLQQAQAEVTAAEAVQAQAALDAEKIGQLLKVNAATQREYDRVVSVFKAADADLLRSREAVNEVQATLDYATVKAPFTGIVIDKKVDVGDMVTPGQILLVLFDPTQMQLVASVRESLAQRLRVGQSIGVQVDVLDKMCRGSISEIVPEAQSASRSFLVKVTGPCPSGIYSGMFGRIIIPLQDEKVLVIPRRMVREVGQLELVEVRVGAKVNLRAVRLGRTFGDDVEVLAGLRESEQVVLSSVVDKRGESAHD